MSLQLKQRLVMYTDPLYLVFVFLSGFVRAVVSCLVTLDIRSLCSLSKLRSLGFARAFSKMGAGFRAREATTAVPALVASARGIVLELGPGIGSQCDRYDPTQVKRVFGVEPNADMAAELRNAADKAGLGAKYQIMTCGIEDLDALKAQGITEGSIDCVLSIQVLCSVPRPEEVIAALYRLLKPGGELIVFEHLACKDRGHRLAQILWNPIWQYALAGCSMDRQTDAWLVNAGKWDSIDLEWDKQEVSLFPRVWGRLVKAKV